MDATPPTSPEPVERPGAPLNASPPDAVEAAERPETPPAPPAADLRRIPPRGNSLLVFFLLTFAISWSAWVPEALASHGLIPPLLDATLLDLLGVFSPFIAALLCTAVFDGRSGFGALWRRFWTLRVGIFWYLFVLLWPAARSLLNTLIAVLLGSPWPDFSTPPILLLYPLPPDLPPPNPLILLPIVFLQQTLLGSSLGEEPGWRGYALPRMQALPWREWKSPALASSLTLGLIWGFWYLPQWLTRGHPLSETFLGWTILSLLADSILFTWVFNHTRGSLFLALLFRTSIAITDLFVSAAPTHPLIAVAISWALAGLVIWRGGLEGTRQAAPSNPGDLGLLDQQ